MRRRWTAMFILAAFCLEFTICYFSISWFVPRHGRSLQREASRVDHDCGLYRRVQMALVSSRLARYSLTRDWRVRQRARLRVGASNTQLRISK